MIPYRRNCPQLSKEERAEIAVHWRYARKAGWILSAQRRHERLMAFRLVRAKIDRPESDQRGHDPSQSEKPHR